MRVERETAIYKDRLEGDIQRVFLVEVFDREVDHQSFLGNWEGNLQFGRARQDPLRQLTISKAVDRKAINWSNPAVSGNKDSAWDPHERTHWT